MGIPDKKGRPGDPFSISASMQNKLVDIVSAAPGNSVNPKQLSDQSNIILIRNSTGSALSQFNVVGLDDVLHDPAGDGVLAFKQYAGMDTDTPAVASHMLKYGIVQEPIPVSGIGRCLVAGYSIVKLKVNKSWHKFAVIVDGQTGYLETAPAGDALIQWAAGGEGETDWALVCIKAGEPLITFGKCKTNWHKAAGDGSYVEVNPCQNLAGDNVDSSKTIKIWLPRYGRTDDPNIVANTIIPYILTEHGLATPEGICVGEYLDGKIDVTLRLLVDGSDIPAGWSEMTGYDKKTIAFGTAPRNAENTKNITGYDTHGNALNDHENHYDANVNWDWQNVKHPADGSLYPHVGPGAVISLPLSSSGLSQHEITSNWPPYQVITIIKRIDNSV